jgi:hypothetical protein
MNTKTILLILGVCLLIGYAVYYNFYSDNARVNLKYNFEKQYQGPVPEGYDEEYFRETGITKPLENKR